MEGTPHFGCWCKLCMLSEWMELEAEINQLVFGRKESYYTLVPSPSFTRCTPTDSPVASTTPSPFGTSVAINDKPLRSAGSTSQRTDVISPKRRNQMGCQFLTENDRTNPRGLPTPNSCIPPRSIAKRQKKTQADLERAEPPICRRLHVSNIPFWFEDHHLVKIFQDVGNVIQAEVIYNERGSKGFGFVTFEDENQAIKIRKLFNGLELHGRVIEVNYASKRQGNKSRPQPSRECARPVRSTYENPRNKGPPCRHCEPPHGVAGWQNGGAGRSNGAAGRLNGAGAWPPQHRQNTTRIPRMPPTPGWPQHHRRKLGPRL